MQLFFYYQGAISYVPQQAWIQNMTLRDNILFSKTYNKDKYDQVLDACALVEDLKILTGGDQTEIGERVRPQVPKIQAQRIHFRFRRLSNNDILTDL